MYQKSTRSIGRMFNVLGSAVAVAAATRNGTQPLASDLRQLGIDPVQFRSIQRGRFSVSDI